MRHQDEQIELRRRERFKVMAVRLANHLQMSSADTWEKLPLPVQEYFESQRYCDVVRVLIIKDNHGGQSVRQLSIKYGLSSTAIQNHLSKNK
jgi:hypothetical protein